MVARLYYDDMVSQDFFTVTVHDGLGRGIQLRVLKDFKTSLDAGVEKFHPFDDACSSDS